MEYWNPKVERLSAEELKQLQERKLRRVVENAYEYSSFYKKLFAAAGFSPADIRSLEDIQQLPFTRKTDLRDTYPTGMFSVPRMIHHAFCPVTPSNTAVVASTVTRTPVPKGIR